MKILKSLVSNYRSRVCYAQLESRIEDNIGTVYITVLDRTKQKNLLVDEMDSKIVVCSRKQKATGS